MVKNIIFDLGVVLLDVDYQKTIVAFEMLGLENAEMAFSKHRQDVFFKSFERGQISDDEFLNGLAERTLHQDKNALRSAWCAMLGNLPREKFELLKKLKDEYKLFILSNTNSIHQEWFEQKIDEQYGWSSFTACFEFIAYSHEIGERKPDAEIFEIIPKRFGLDKGETLFIDDTMEHVLGSRRAGIQAIHYKEGENLERLLEEYLA
ncbi:MAG: HAD family phosphatase [Bacteroidota bacterium]